MSRPCQTGGGEIAQGTPAGPYSTIQHVSRSAASSVTTPSLSGVSTREISQLRRKVTEQEQAFSQQHEAYARKHTLFQDFDGALKDKGLTIQFLVQELANRTFVKLEQARQ